MITALAIASLVVSLGCAGFVGVVFWLGRDGEDTPIAAGASSGRTISRAVTVDCAAGDPVVYLTADEVEALYHRGVLVTRQAAGSA